MNATRENPSDPSAHYGLGNALALLKHYDEALQQFTLAVQLAPNYVDAHYNRAVCLATLGRVQEALQEYQEVLRIDPNYEQARSAIEILHGAIPPPTL